MYNLIQVQNRLKELPKNPQTMQYLTAASKGQNPEIPPYVALGEIQRREAMDSQMATAQGAAKGPTPTVADQMEAKAKEKAMGLMALQQGRQAAAQQQPAPQGGPAPENTPQPEQQEEAPAMMAQGGLARLPVDSQMFNYKQGGVIGYNGESDSDVKNPELDMSPEAINERYRQAQLEKIKALFGLTGVSRGSQSGMTPEEKQARAQAPTAAPQQAARPISKEDMAMRRAPTPEEGIAKLLPTPPPAAPRARPQVQQAPQAAQAPVAPPAQSELERLMMERVREAPPKPMTDEQIIAQNAGLRPAGLSTPAGSEEMKRLDAMQKQYEAGTANRGLEGLMAGLAGRTRGAGGFGSAYLTTAEANRKADAEQAALQNKMRAGIEATRRGEDTTEFGRRTGVRTAEQARADAQRKDQMDTAEKMFASQNQAGASITGHQIMAKAQTDAARIMAAARENAGSDAAGMRAVAAAERAYEMSPEVKNITEKLKSPLYLSTSDPKRLAEMKLMLDDLNYYRQRAYAAQQITLPDFGAPPSARVGEPQRPPAVDAAFKRYK